MRSAIRLAAVVMMVGASSGLACAHGDAEKAAAGTIPAKDTSEQPEQLVVVTGSHLRQRVKDVCGGLPAGINNVRVYCRDQLLTTGPHGDVGHMTRGVDSTVDVVGAPQARPSTGKP